MTYIEKITEGLSGAASAQLLYDNDSRLSTEIEGVKNDADILPFGGYASNVTLTQQSAAPGTIGTVFFVTPKTGAKCFALRATVGTETKYYASWDTVYNYQSYANGLFTPRYDKFFYYLKDKYEWDGSDLVKLSGGGDTIGETDILPFVAIVANVTISESLLSGGDVVFVSSKSNDPTFTPRFAYRVNVAGTIIYVNDWVGRDQYQTIGGVFREDKLYYNTTNKNHYRWNGNRLQRIIGCTEVSSIDVNTFTEDGQFYANSFNNAPESGEGWFENLLRSPGSSSDSVQRIYYRSTGTSYQRILYAGYGQWQKITTTNV